MPNAPNQSDPSSNQPNPLSNQPNPPGNRPLNQLRNQQIPPVPAVVIYTVTDIPIDMPSTVPALDAKYDKFVRTSDELIVRIEARARALTAYLDSLRTLGQRTNLTLAEFHVRVDAEFNYRCHETRLIQNDINANTAVGDELVGFPHVRTREKIASVQACLTRVQSAKMVMAVALVEAAKEFYSIKKAVLEREAPGRQWVAEGFE